MKKYVIALVALSIGLNVSGDTLNSGKTKPPVPSQVGKYQALFRKTRGELDLEQVYLQYLQGKLSQHGVDTQSIQASIKDQKSKIEELEKKAWDYSTKIGIAMKNEAISGRHKGALRTFNNISNDLEEALQKAEQTDD